MLESTGNDQPSKDGSSEQTLCQERRKWPDHTPVHMSMFSPRSASSSALNQADQLQAASMAPVSFSCLHPIIILGTLPPSEQCILPQCAEFGKGVLPVVQAQGSHLEVMPSLLYIPTHGEERKPPLHLKPILGTGISSCLFNHPMLPATALPYHDDSVVCQAPHMPTHLTCSYSFSHRLLVTED